MTSMPISRCLVTTHATASWPAAASASSSTVSPRERRANRRVSSGGLGRLPACVVKIRGSLFGKFFDCRKIGCKIEARPYVVGQACVALQWHRGSLMGDSPVRPWRDHHLGKARRGGPQIMPPSINLPGHDIKAPGNLADRCAWRKSLRDNRVASCVDCVLSC